MENKIIYGLFLSPKHENAPSFVKARVSVKVETFTKFLEENKNASGYVNFDLLESKAGSLYFKLNDFQPKSFATETERIATQSSEEISIDEIPF
jgi:hypothetical protein